MTSRRETQISQEAEAAVLGSILLVPDNLYEHEITDRLVVEDFGVWRHQAVFEAILTCESKGVPFHDLVVLGAELERQNNLKKIGGPEFLESLLTSPGEERSIGAHLDIIHEKSVLRRIAQAGSAMLTESTKPGAEADVVLEGAETAVFGLGEHRQIHRFVSLRESVPELIEELANTRGARLLGTPSGFDSLDDLTSGFQPGQLVIVAARPGMGKTSLSLQIAKNVAKTSEKHVAFASYEMGRLELMQRILSTATGLSIGEIRMGGMSTGQERAIVEEVEQMSALPLLIEEMPPPTISGLRSLLRRQARRTPLSMVVVDYIQLMSGSSSRENRTQELTEITRSLKLLARELEIPIVALSQLNRNVEQRENKRPRLGDLRESGSIEQDADIVMFLYRESIYNAIADPHAAELIVAKQRSGATGSINMKFTGRCTRFEDKGAASGGSVIAPNSGGSGGLVPHRPPRNSNQSNESPF